MSSCYRNLTDWWLHLLHQHRAIAVIRASDLAAGVAMAKAAASGGMRLIEITWNSVEPGTLISQLRSELPECAIGTGTLLTVEQLREAIACGAQFGFTPHVNLPLIQAALESQVPIVPGALSPTEIITAWQAGAEAVKVFPVQSVGGVSYLQTLQGPLPQIPLIPTGGVTLDNAAQFIQAGAIAVGLAGDLFPAQAVVQKDWQVISQRAQVLQQKLAPFQGH
jgi:2-dehydro-3-deoxyphosphogluconate aldolase/(4S)-4-hydroxy-2-oxoglutarate aldolase